MAALSEPVRDTRLPVLRPSATAVVLWVTEQGQWRAVAPVIERYGVESDETREALAAIVGTRPCRVCGWPLCAPDPRVRYCGNGCQERASKVPGVRAPRRQARKLVCLICGGPLAKHNRKGFCLPCWRQAEQVAKAGLVTLATGRCLVCGRLLDPLSREHYFCSKECTHDGMRAALAAAIATLTAERQEVTGAR